MSGKKNRKVKRGNKLLAIFFITIGLLLLFVFLLWYKFSDVIEKYQSSYIHDVQGELVNLLDENNDNIVEDLEEFSIKYKVELLVQENNTIVYTSNSITSVAQQETIYDKNYAYKSVFYEDNYSIWMCMVTIDINEIINYYLLATIIITVLITLLSLGLILYFFKSFTKPFVFIMELIDSFKSGKANSALSVNDLDVISSELIGLHNKIALVQYNYESISTIYETEKKSSKEIIDEQMKYLSTVLHDIKTPLSSIDISRFNLEKQFSDDSKAMESINNISIQSKRTLELIVNTLNNVIDDSDSIYFDSSEIYIGEEIDDFIVSSKVLLESKNIDVNINVSDITIVVNPLKFSQILTNIIANMIEYSKANSVLKIYETNNQLVFENEIGNQKSEKSTLFGIERIKELCVELGISYESEIRNNRYYSVLGFGDNDV